MSRVSGVAERIRLQVVSGRIGPGERLPELDLQQRMGTGRGTLAQALRLLEGRGLVEADEAGGMRVVRPSDQELLEALQTRAALEALAAGTAAGRPLEPTALDAVAQLGDQAEETARRGAPSDAAVADRRFHLALADLGHNRPGLQALDRVWDLLLIATSPVGLWSDGLPLRPGEHRALLADVVGGRADAAEAAARAHALAPPAAPARLRLPS